MCYNVFISVLFRCTMCPERRHQNMRVRYLDCDNDNCGQSLGKLYANCKVIFQQNLANVAGYHSYLNKQKPNSKQFRESISL